MHSDAPINQPNDCSLAQENGQILQNAMRENLIADCRATTIASLLGLTSSVLVTSLPSNNDRSTGTPPMM